MALLAVYTNVESLIPDIDEAIPQCFDYPRTPCGLRLALPSAMLLDEPELYNGMLVLVFRDMLPDDEDNVIKTVISRLHYLRAAGAPDGIHGVWGAQIHHVIATTCKLREDMTLWLSSVGPVYLGEHLYVKEALASYTQAAASAPPPKLVGLPKLDERMRGELLSAGAKLVQAQWMECRVEVFKPQRALRRREGEGTVDTPRPGIDSPAADSPAGGEGAEDEDDEAEDDELFNWVYVALMSDHTLRQYEDEDMSTELGQLKLGYLVQCSFLDDPPDATYEHAFRVKPDGALTDSWVLCPDTRNDSIEWMNVLKA